MGNRIILFLIVNVITLFSFGQTGSMIITDTPSKADSMSVLEVKSESKGVLLPRMTYNQMQNIDNPKDGLSIYVTDNSSEGIWYWDGKQAVWTRVEVEEPGLFKAVAPVESIVMYVGSMDVFDETGLGLSNTKMDGWALCNGNNGSPDLSKKFIVGKGQEKQAETAIDPSKYPSYTYKSSNNVPDTFQLDINTMPEHTHTIKSEGNSATIDHSHKVTDAGHDHTVQGIFDSKSKDRGFIPVPVKSQKKEKPLFSLDKSSDDIIIRSPANTSVEYSFPSDLIGYFGGISEEGVAPDQKKVKSFDNRPPFIVVAYIIKISD